MKYRTALVLGMGESGQAAAKLLQGEGTQVWGCDANTSEGLHSACRALRDAGVRVSLGIEVLPDKAFDVCIVSPGIAADAPWLQHVRRMGWPIVSELELGFSRSRAPCIAVTGTNGKSTCVKLIERALAAQGLRVALGGNYGTALCRLVAQQQELDWIVAEVSSFQLEHVDTFRPRAGVVLNVQPDHLDRHGSMSRYRAVKARMLRRMSSGDTAIVHAPESAAVRECLRADAGDDSGGGVGTWWTFGCGAEATFRYVPGAVMSDQASGGCRVNVAGTRFDNAVLGQTAAAATAVLASIGALEVEEFEKVLAGFAGLPHRMSVVDVIRGVTYIDDSKATNLAAMIGALDMVPGRVNLIAGGRLKEANIGDVKEILGKRVRTAYLIGEAAKSMEDAWSDRVDCVACGVLDVAVEMVARDASPGEVVLLSPGCASFDQFESFSQRGNRFQSLVRALPRGD